MLLHFIKEISHTKLTLFVNRFAQKCYMIQHIVSVHEGNKPFKCEFCEISFSRRPEMRRHVATIHDGKKAKINHILDYHVFFFVNNF